MISHERWGSRKKNKGVSDVMGGWLGSVDWDEQWTLFVNGNQLAIIAWCKWGWAWEICTIKEGRSPLHEWGSLVALVARPWNRASLDLHVGFEYPGQHPGGFTDPLGHSGAYGGQAWVRALVSSQATLQIFLYKKEKVCLLGQNLHHRDIGNTSGMVHFKKKFFVCCKGFNQVKTEKVLL